MSTISDKKIYVREITLGQYPYHEDAIKKYVKKGDVLLLNGGGSTGIEWFDAELLGRRIITAFPKNRVIILPQTIYYGDSDFGKQELENSIELYSRHPDLHICAREKTSYDIMRECYKMNNIYLVPDMVLYLEKTDPRLDRAGVVLCLRHDPEGVLGEENHITLKDTAAELDKSVTFTDTVISEANVYARREFFFQEKLNQFKRARLVVTDRLHGMVFCAITGTPCVVLSNYNHKVRGVYEWISDLEYISYAENIEDAREAMRRLYSAGGNSARRYSAAKLAPLYDTISELIQGET